MAEVDYKERLRVRRESIIPKNQVMLNSVISEPKTLDQIKSALIVHGHEPKSSIKRFRTLLDQLGIVRFPFMCSPDERGNKNSWGWRYGLRDLIEQDFDGTPDECNYINRTSWYLRKTIGDNFYRSLDQ